MTEVGLLSRHVDKEELRHVAWPEALLVFLGEMGTTEKDSRIAAIYFWYSARYSAWVLQFRILVMNS